MDTSNQDSAKLPQLSPASAIGTTIARCEAELAPATLKQGKSELGACLTLVSPSGLNADDRKEWLAVAMQTLSGIPADLLARGCAKVRRTCRFPSEIVPTIMEAVGETWRWRQRNLEEAEARAAAMMRPPQPEPEYVRAEEIQKLIKSLGR